MWLTDEPATAIALETILMGDELSARATLRDARHYFACAQAAIAHGDRDSVRRELTTVVEKMQSIRYQLERSATGKEKGWRKERESQLKKNDVCELFKRLRHFTVHQYPLRVGRNMYAVADASATASAEGIARVLRGNHSPNTSKSSEQHTGTEPGAAPPARSGGKPVKPDLLPQRSIGNRATAVRDDRDTWHFRDPDWGDVPKDRVPRLEALLDRPAPDLCAECLEMLEALVVEAEGRWGHEPPTASDSP